MPSEIKKKNGITHADWTGNKKVIGWPRRAWTPRNNFYDITYTHTKKLSRLCRDEKKDTFDTSTITSVRVQLHHLEIRLNIPTDDFSVWDRIFVDFYNAAQSNFVSKKKLTVGNGYK